MAGGNEIVTASGAEIAALSGRRLRMSFADRLALFGFAIALLACIANWYQSYSSIELLRLELQKMREANEAVAAANDEARKNSWQELVVYSIVDKAFRENDLLKGVPFDQIQAKYLDAAAMVSNVNLASKDIQADTLQRLLLSLMKNQLVYKTSDDTYSTNRVALDPRFSRQFFEERAKYAILNTLTIDGGKYSIAQLAQVISDTYKISGEEFNAIINELVAQNAVKIAEDGKVYSATNAKPK